MNRLAKFHSCPTENSGWLRDVDPDCADALNGFWEMTKAGFEGSNQPPPGLVLNGLERDVHKAVANLLGSLSDSERRERLNKMHERRAEDVRKIGGWK